MPESRPQWFPRIGERIIPTPEAWKRQDLDGDPVPGRVVGAGRDGLIDVAHDDGDNPEGDATWPVSDVLPMTEWIRARVEAMGPEEWERRVLDVDPFAGDFGEPDDRRLSDKIVTARKPGECRECAGPIVPGARVRSITMRFDGELVSGRICRDCCDAMAVWEDEPGELEDRIQRGIEKREAAMVDATGPAGEGR